MIQSTLTSLLDNHYVIAGLWFIFGWEIRKGYIHLTTTDGIGRSKIELVNNAIAHQVVARCAIGFLSENEKKALEDAVNEELDEDVYGESDLDVK